MYISMEYLIRGGVTVESVRRYLFLVRASYIKMSARRRQIKKKGMAFNFFFSSFFRLWSERSFKDKNWTRAEQKNIE